MNIDYGDERKIEGNIFIRFRTLNRIPIMLRFQSVTHLTSDFAFRCTSVFGHNPPNKGQWKNRRGLILNLYWRLKKLMSPFSPRGDVFALKRIVIDCKYSQYLVN